MAQHQMSPQEMHHGLQLSNLSFNYEDSEYRNVRHHHNNVLQQEGDLLETQIVKGPSLGLRLTLAISSFLGLLLVTSAVILLISMTKNDPDFGFVHLLLFLVLGVFWVVVLAANYFFNRSSHF